MFTWENLHPAYRDLARLKRDRSYRASPLVHINEQKNNQEEDNYPVISRLPSYPIYRAGSPPYKQSLTLKRSIAQNVGNFAVFPNSAVHHLNLYFYFLKHYTGHHF